MKRLIAFAVCLVLCASSFFIGMQNIAKPEKLSLDAGDIAKISAGVNTNELPTVSTGTGGTVKEIDYDDHAVEIYDAIAGTTGLTFSTEFSVNKNKEGIACGDSVSFKNTAETYLTFTFTGVGVEVYGGKGSDNAIVEVYLDGAETPTATVDLYSATAITSELMYSVSGLTYGEHTVVIKNTGTKNESSKNTYMSFDYFKVTKNTREVKGYELTGNITLSKGSTELIKVQHALNNGKVFDGKGYTITISKNSSLFLPELGLKGGTIKNVAITNTVDRTVSSLTSGMIADTVTSGNFKFQNVVLDTAIVNNQAMTGNNVDAAGGFIGCVAGNATVEFENCEFRGSIKNPNRSNAGGFVGVIATDSTGSVKLTNCTSSATLFVAEQVGGFIGIVRGNATVSLENCDSSVNIDKTQPTTKQMGCPGGIIGLIDSTSNVSIVECESTARIAYNAEKNHFGGGIVGSINIVSSLLIENTVFDGSLEIPQANAADNRLGGFIGNISGGNSSEKTVTIKNCENKADLSLNINTGSFGLAYGAFIGRFDRNNNDSVNWTINFENCVNNGDAFVNSYGTGGINVAAMIGLYRTNGPINITNCVNNGDISVYMHNGNGGTQVGVLSGAALRTPSIKINGFVNNGDISAYVRDKTVAVSGGIADSGTGLTKLDISNYVNNGDITAVVWNGYKRTSTDAETDGIKKDAGTATENLATAIARAAGFAPNLVFGTDASVNGYINTGDITAINESDTTSSLTQTGAISAGFAGLSSGTVTLSKAINSGKITVTAGTDADGNVNDSSIAADFFATVIESKELKATVKDSLKLGTVINNSIGGEIKVTENNVKTYSLAEVFTVDATMTNGSSVAKVDKEFYDFVETIFGDENIKFEGFVTLANYETKIGKFTHKAFDEYYNANKTALAAKGVTSLYMDAVRDEANIGDTDTIVDGDYNVNIRLNGAKANITYTAKAFIKIGNAYIYSTVAE